MKLKINFDCGFSRGIKLIQGLTPTYVPTFYWIEYNSRKAKEKTLQEV